MVIPNWPSMSLVRANLFSFCTVLGAGAAIGAGAIVTKDVPPFAIAVGNPARVLRKRFSEEIIEGIETLAWWDWPLEQLAETLSDFRALSVEAFLTKYLDA